MAIAAGIWMVLAGAVFIGLGVGCVTPLLMALIAALSTPENSGKHMGAYATALNLGQFACSPLTGATLAFFGTHQAVFAVGACIGFVASCVSLALDRRLERQ
jgi:MFS family permease